MYQVGVGGIVMGTEMVDVPGGGGDIDGYRNG